MLVLEHSGIQARTEQDCSSTASYVSKRQHLTHTLVHALRTLVYTPYALTCTHLTYSHVHTLHTHLYTPYILTCTHLTHSRVHTLHTYMYTPYTLTCTPLTYSHVHTLHTHMHTCPFHTSPSLQHLRLPPMPLSCAQIK